MVDEISSIHLNIVTLLRGPCYVVDKAVARVGGYTSDRIKGLAKLKTRLSKTNLLSVDFGGHGTSQSQ